MQTERREHDGARTRRHELDGEKETARKRRREDNFVHNIKERAEKTSYTKYRQKVREKRICPVIV